MLVLISGQGGRNGNVSDCRLSRRWHGQPDSICVLNAAILDQDRVTVRLFDDHRAGRLIGHIELDTLGKDPIVGRVSTCQAMVDEAGPPFDLQGDNGRGYITAHVKGVAAETADDRRLEIGTGTENEEVVVSL